jgi:hypothetical protein
MISARVAPLGRPISSRIVALLLSARGTPFFFAGDVLAPFFATFDLPPLAALCPFCAPFFGVAPFFEETFPGATCAPCSVTEGTLLLVSAFVMVVLGPFLRLFRA